MNIENFLILQLFVLSLLQCASLSFTSDITDFIGWEVVKLKFTPDQKIVQHSIAIVSDDVPEEDETFTLSLSERRARVIINPNFAQAKVTITEVVRKYLITMMVHTLRHVHVSLKHKITS